MLPLPRLPDVRNRYPWTTEFGLHLIVAWVLKSLKLAAKVRCFFFRIMMSGENNN